MGKGDKKTKKGKIAIGTFGNRRPKRSKTTKAALSTKKKAKKKPATKAKAKPKVKKESEA